jgi:hypothetical protein
MTAPVSETADLESAVKMTEVGMKEANIIESKQLRVQIDECIQSLRKAQLNRSSRERSTSLTKLQEAVMWLGMDLKELNAPNPYPNSYNPSNTIVDKTADGLKL